MGYIVHGHVILILMYGIPRGFFLIIILCMVLTIGLTMTSVFGMLECDIYGIMPYNAGDLRKNVLHV